MTLNPTVIEQKHHSDLLDNGRLILEVFSASPASAIGLGSGWSILQIAGRSPSERLIAAAELDLTPRVFMVADPDGRIFCTDPIPWPFGMVTVPWPGKSFAAKISRGRFDPEELVRYWKAGALNVFPDFIEPLKHYLSRRSLGILGRLRRQLCAPETIAQHPDYTGLALLALALAADKQWQDAEFYLTATRQSRVRADQASYSTIDSSMDAYTESLIALALGDTPRAHAFATKASQFAHDIWEVERHFATLEGRAPTMAVPEWTAQTFPVDYTLRAHDPIDEIKSNVDQVGLREVLIQLKPGEMLCIMVMGSYRSNYYYNLDLERLAVLHNAFPGTIKEVHVIVSGTYALDARHRRYSEGFARKHNLPFAILWDEECLVEDQILPQGSPARFLIDCNATILATERLMEEEGYWKAIERQMAQSTTRS